MLFAAATLASLSQQPETVKVETTLDTSGPGYVTPLANYDPTTSFWKMYGATYLWGDSPLLENLPISGMTRNGELFRRPAWAHTIDENVLSLWPTPRANSAMASLITKDIADDPRRFPNLETVVGQRMTQGESGRLNPEWIEWLMGFPTSWTDLKD
jgi:hypothetical protein